MTTPGPGRVAFTRRDLLAAVGVATTVGAAGCVDDGDDRPDDPRRLRVDGNAIVTAAGDPVTLRGISTIDPKRAVRTRHTRGRGPLETIDHLTDAEAGWHPDAIRVPVQPNDVGDHPPGHAVEPPAFSRAQLDAYLREYLDPVVERCRERGVYAVVDFHRHWPGVNWADLATGEVNAPLREEARTFWDAVAPRYADAPHVVYEAYNEPTEPGMWGPISDPEVRRVWELFLEFIQPVVDTIRLHADTLTLVGSPGWSQGPKGALIEPVAGEHLAYTYHIYPGHDVSRERDWDAAGAGGVDRVYETVPLVVSEFGWRDYDDEWFGGTTSAFGEPFVRWLESHDAIHWLAWCADVRWDPAMFDLEFETGRWLLRGRETGSPEDSGEYLRQALAAGGVPEDYWERVDGD